MIRHNWYGPPVNNPNSSMHGAIPWMRDGKFRGWIMPNGIFNQSSFGWLIA